MIPEAPFGIVQQVLYCDREMVVKLWCAVRNWQQFSWHLMKNAGHRLWF
jgi:hypothetical protein